MRKVAIIGAGGHAKVLIDIIEKSDDARLVGLIDRPENVGQSVLGHKIIGADQDIPALLKNGDVDALVIGVGDNAQRRRIYDAITAMAPEAPFTTALHPAANIGLAVEIGAGSVVMAGATVNPNCQIGRHCVVNTNASLDHDSTLGDFAALAPNSATGGNVRIGRDALVGMGASIVQGLTVGDAATVGAGSVVLKDVAAQATVVGSPAKAVAR